MPSGKCIRCYFSGERKATDEILVKYGSAEYALDLCGTHAREFDDLMWGWLRAAREIVDDNFAGQLGMSESLKLAPRVAPEPARGAPMPAAAPPLVRTDLDLLRLRWIMTDHANERLAERGPIYGFTIDDVLRAADAPERANRGNEEGLWVHWRGNLKVVVNRETKVIVTVGGKEAEDRATA